MFSAPRTSMVHDVAKTRLTPVEPTRVLHSCTTGASLLSALAQDALRGHVTASMESMVPATPLASGGAAAHQSALLRLTQGQGTRPSQYQPALSEADQTKLKRKFQGACSADDYRRIKKTKGSTTGISGLALMRSSPALLNAKQKDRQLVRISSSLSLPCLSPSLPPPRTCVSCICV